jgi:hypothetical protein
MAGSSQRAAAQDVWSLPSIAGQSCNPCNLPSSGSDIIPICPGAASDVCLTEPNLNTFWSNTWQLDHFESDPPNSIDMANSTNPGACGQGQGGNTYTRHPAFLTPGLVALIAVYRSINLNIFTGHYDYTTRRLRFQVNDGDRGVQFGINPSSNLCAPPLTSITISRSYPNAEVQYYRIKLYDNTSQMLYNSGWQSGNFTNYTISSAQYTNFAAGQTYSISVEAKFGASTACNISPDIIYTKSANFTIAPKAVSAFNLTGGVLKLSKFYTVKLCEANTPINVVDVSTVPACSPITGVKFRYRPLLYEYINAPMINSSGAGNETQVFTPTANRTYNLSGIIGNSGTNFYSLEMQVQTAIGWSNWTTYQYLEIQPSPGTASVNFGFRGGTNADAYTPVTATSCTTNPEGELYTSPAGNSCSDADGWLGNGGTLNNPIWVGANYMTLSGFALSNVMGGMQSYRVEIWRETPTKMLVGQTTGGNVFPSGGIFINELYCHFSPTAPYNQFAFTDAMRPPGNGMAFDGHKFQAKLFVTDVCGKTWESDATKGFFKIIPNQPNWRLGGKSIYELDEIEAKLNTEKLVVYPNPATNQISIEFAAEKQCRGLLNIMSIDGKINKYSSVDIIVGRNSFEQNISDLPNGVYLVHLQQDDSSITQKFIKIN